MHLVIVSQDGGVASTTMRQVTVQVTNDSSCNSPMLLMEASVQMICAAVLVRGRDACQVTGSR